MHTRTSLSIWLALTAVMLCGCFGSSPPSRFYLLEESVTPVAESPASSLVIGIGPIRFPDYLDRPQIVTRDGNELELAEFDRWAAPLQTNFVAILADNVSRATGSNQVYGFPFAARVELDYRVVGAVRRFDADRSGQAVLLVHWGVQDGEGEVILATTRKLYSQSAPPDDYSGMVSALNRLVADLGQDIARALEQLGPPVPTPNPN